MKGGTVVALLAAGALGVWFLWREDKEQDGEDESAAVRDTRFIPPAPRRELPNIPETPYANVGRCNECGERDD